MLPGIKLFKELLGSRGKSVFSVLKPLPEGLGLKKSPGLMAPASPGRGEGGEAIPDAGRWTSVGGPQGLPTGRSSVARDSEVGTEG